MLAVSAIAGECGIPGLEIGSHSIPAVDELYPQFVARVQREIARVRVRGRIISNLYSVQLASNTRTKIEHYISLIRQTIETSDLSAERRKALEDKLDELSRELANRRVGFGKMMAILGAVLVGLASGTTVAAEGPAAVTNIMKPIAIDKDSEEVARLRLAPPQKALAAPANQDATGKTLGV